MASALSLSNSAPASEWSPLLRLRAVAPADKARDDASRAMERYAQGDDRAFDEVYALLAPRLHRLCVCLIGRGEADDLLQEVFLKMHRARATFMAGGSVTAWSFAIARTTSVDRSRRRQRRPEDATEPERIEARSANLGGCPESNAACRTLESVLEARLAKLSESLRAAYVLVKLEGMSCGEAAEVLGISSSAVKQRVHRATDELKAALSSAGW